MLFVATHQTNFQILGSSRIMISFHSFQTMRSVTISRRFFVSPHTSRIRLLQSLFCIPYLTHFGCAPAAAILRSSSKPFEIFGPRVDDLDQEDVTKAKTLWQAVA